MFTLQGRYATAVCYLADSDEQMDGVIAQILKMLNLPFTEGQRIAIMPDAHPGTGCVIGTTMTVGDKVVPNVVGTDLGCGLLVVDIGAEPIDCERVDASCYAIPSGVSVWDRVQPFAMSDLRCKGHLGDEAGIARSFGTLGGGNHFIEIDVADDGTQYLVIHSGSRKLGLAVAKYYQRMATESLDGSGVPRDLCWLTGQAMDDYLHDVAVAQRWARRSREIMAEQICDVTGLSVRGMFHTVHNYIDVDEMVLRKGAVSAKAGERLIIPMNMRDGAVLACGRGNEAWNMSAPHGAGRRLSRSRAKESIGIEEYRRQMEGIYTTSVTASTIDEAPDAYKSEDDIFGIIDDSVDVTEIIRPIYNFKAH